MKILLVGHNVLSRSDNMGKTLLRSFGSFAKGEVAQLYIHSEVPTDASLCTNYYRFTDIDALKSIIPIKKQGCIFSEADIDTERESSRTDEGLTGDIYQFGRKRTPAIYCARNTVWRMSHWYTAELKKWLRDFNPDVIFFASGDYAFLYEVTAKIADYLNIPVIVYCCDDYYLQNPNEGAFMGDYVHKNLLKAAKKVFSRALFGVAICRSMAEEYKKLFGVDFNVFYTGAEAKELNLAENADRISYMGNLSMGRDSQLVSMGRALKGLNRTEEPKLIDVYSGEKRAESLALMTEENGIHFHGKASQDEVMRVMENSMAVIHTESFGEKNMREVRFSMSTKIAESLMYGPCLIAYGPEGIASMDYVKETGSAYVINSAEALSSGLKEIIEKPEMRKNIVLKARKTAADNHNSSLNGMKLRKWIEEALEGRE